MIHLEARHLELVRRILAKHVPGKPVWVFGSRATGVNLKPFSDLDLAIIADAPLEPGLMAHLLEDFSESTLPFKVDLLDWSVVSADFRRHIESSHAVLGAGEGQSQKQQ